ncbi:DUF3592 domain-containing protein [Flagellimonas nanhaiensis]|uniref:DUF3592 domain-containing protein n=1 Tax=Flagellimonas nanhaiensis TaxID=2292706 RepID=A0A371JQB9_9FLAO|nr:DUF3592 domain-containing protein [Allomuricauda nanhaiensis]RDY59710.1 DUF3592 domain-containing protein [Allomuricauda nanhaiensis]
MAAKRYTMWLLLYGGFFALGLLLSYFAVQQYNKTQNLLMDGIRTTAVVTELQTNYDSDGTTYTPIFEFKDRTNALREYISPIASSPPSYQVGDKVKIVYDRKDFGNVKIVAFWGLYRASVILMMIASPLLVIGGSYLLYTLR